jgi:hypothetical protein
MKIKFEHAMLFLNVVNKMGIKKDVVEIFKKVVKLNTRKENLYRELYKFAEEGIEITNEVSLKLLNGHKEIASELDEIKEEMSLVMGTEVLFLLIENLPKAQNEMIKMLSKIYEIKESEVKEKDIDEIIPMFMEILKSESISKVFTLMQK